MSLSGDNLYSILFIILFCVIVNKFLNSFNSKDWGNFFATEGSMQPPQKEYDIVNNDLTHALDAQQNAVEQWAKQEGVAVR